MYVNGPYRAGGHRRLEKDSQNGDRQEKTDGNFRTAKKGEAEDDNVKSL